MNLTSSKVCIIINAPPSMLDLSLLTILDILRLDGLMVTCWSHGSSKYQHILLVNSGPFRLQYSSPRHQNSKFRIMEKYKEIDWLQTSQYFLQPKKQTVQRMQLPPLLCLNWRQTQCRFWKRVIKVKLWKKSLPYDFYSEKYRKQPC